ncbi:MAG TPA: hypothetical protein VNG33_14000 [Polyangiaceae bacterium]|nr:hypothetical protein [Polyangiaceae bacterium]
MPRTVSPVFCSVLTALGLVGVIGWSGSASAQAAPISDCYFDAGRMVDAQALMGTKKETDEVTGNLHYLVLTEGLRQDQEVASHRVHARHW